MHAMQMSLTGPLPRPGAAVGGAQRLTPLSREAVMSQLDRIAAAEARPLSGQGLGGKAGLLALLGGLFVLGSALMWRAPDTPRRDPVASAQPQASPGSARAAAVAAEVSAPAPVLLNVAAATVPPAAEAAAPASVTAMTTAAARHPKQEVLAAPAPAAGDDAARKARAKQQAEARRKAAQLAQELAQAQEAQRLAVLAQSSQERAEQAAEDERRRLAAEQRARVPVVVAALDTSRRSVADACAGSGGFFGQHSCRTRECSRPEHQGDSVCVRLREGEEVQRRASMER